MICINFERGFIKVSAKISTGNSLINDYMYFNINMINLSQIFKINLIHPVI